MLRIPRCLDTRLTVICEILRERERERERERKREKGEVVEVRDTTLVGGGGNIYWLLVAVLTV
jgi:hypothetical protein